ncbi:MAG: DUF6029 family protein [Bacteroidales bacterium]|jgi:hypothetical protein|nr:DUF6029 family protein [Bacteroidales bacterium]
MKKIILLVATLSLSIVGAYSQGILGGKVTGNFQVDVQASKEDSSIGANKVKEKLLNNAFANILYTNGDFTAGFRYEAYLNPILGFDAQYKGAGIPYRFASYKKDFLEVTVGNYYEQFGSGLIFRSYEERNLGLDNAMDGVKIVAKPYSGIVLKGVVGKQRYYWEDIWQNDNGLVRGMDADINLNDVGLLSSYSNIRLSIGGSFVSVYQEAENRYITNNGVFYKMNIPENIGAGAARMNFAYKDFSLSGEYAMKGQDPNATNGYIYRKGQALLLTAGYSIAGLGVQVQAKRIDNMSFKSKRTETGNMLNVNYLPAITRQHSYSLMSMYSYATQINGEMGLQADIMYKIPKHTFLGGKYGTDVKLNYSRINAIDKTAIDGYKLNQEGTKGYNSNFFKVGDEEYWEEINLEVNKKFSKDYKMNFMYSYQTFNPIAFGHEGNPFIYAHIFVVDGTYKLSTHNSLRGEVEWLLTKQDYDEFAKGNWLQGTLEYNLLGRWFFAASDQWNYGTEQGDKIHYYNLSVGCTYNTTRVSISYGKQRQGILCIGGVCREVPASNGLFATITSSF